MTEIIKNLFLGNILKSSGLMNISGGNQESRDLKFLKKNSITHILIVANELKPVYPKTFKYKHVFALDKDGYDLKSHFDGMAEFINEGVT